MAEMPHTAIIFVEAATMPVAFQLRAFSFIADLPKMSFCRR